MAKRGLTGITIIALLLAIFSGVLMLPEKVSPQAYKAALAALQSYQSLHPEENPRYLAVVDYSKPSYLKRMALVELKTGKQMFYRMAHGKNSGELYAIRFSDTPESNMSSLGLFRVLETYSGEHGKAMRLEGLEQALNGNAFIRDIVLHSAGYVSLFTIIENLLTFNGPRIGRSNGCFVVATGDIDEVAEKLANDGFIYAWREENSSLSHGGHNK